MKSKYHVSYEWFGGEYSEILVNIYYTLCSNQQETVSSDSKSFVKTHSQYTICATVSEGTRDRIRGETHRITVYHTSPVQNLSVFRHHNQI